MKTLLLLLALFSFNQAHALIYDYLPSEDITLYELAGVLKVQGLVDKTYKLQGREFIVISNIREIFDGHQITSGTDVEAFCQNIGYESYNSKNTIYIKSDEVSLRLQKLPSEARGFFKVKYLKRGRTVLSELTCWRTI